MNNNPLDAFPYLQQMTQQFRQLFGDDFVKNLMSSMQPPAWTQPPGASAMSDGTPGGPSAHDGQEPRFGASDGRNQAARSTPGAWPNWMGQWNPLSAGGPGAAGGIGSFPPSDVYETRHEVVLVVEVPGLERASDVKLAVYPDRVVVHGDRQRQYSRMVEGSLVQAERVIGSFERSIALPARVRKQHAKATYAQGLLEIRLLKEGRAPDPDANIIDVDFL